MPTFDKLAFVDFPTKRGVPEDQAQAEAPDTASRDSVAAKAEPAGLKADVLKWMFGALLARTAIIAAPVRLP